MGPKSYFSVKNRQNWPIFVNNQVINLYGTKIDNDADDEMITLALKTILAMRKKGKTEVFIG